MKKIIFILLTFCSIFTLQAKDWKIIGKALQNDTTLLEQDATDTSIYKYVGTITTGEFKLSDGTDIYIPVCGMNDPMGQKIDIAAQADANETGFSVKYMNPTKTYIITLTDNSSNPTLEVEMAETYNHLYLIGGPVNTNAGAWQLGDAQELEKDTANQFVFYYRGFLMYNSSSDEGGSFKILTSNASWNPAFHPADSTNVVLSQASEIRLDGTDTKWEIPADGSGNGYYVIKLNTVMETIQVLQFTPSNVAYPKNVYITGDAMPCGWVNDNPEIMTTTDLVNGKYQWSGNVVPGQFKFLKAKNTWGSCYVSTVQDQAVVFGTEYPVVYEFESWNNGGNDYKFIFSDSKKCTIHLDLSAMKMTVIEGLASGINQLENQTAYSIVGYNGIVKASSTDLSPKKITVYSVDGSVRYCNNFVSNIKFNIQKGIYIVVIIDRKTNIICKMAKLAM